MEALIVPQALGPGEHFMGLELSVGNGIVDVDDFPGAFLRLLCVFLTAAENEGTALIFLQINFIRRIGPQLARTLNQPQVLCQCLGPVRFLAHDTGDEPVGTGPEDIADPLPPFGTHFPAGAEPDDIGRQISQEQVQTG